MRTYSNSMEALAAAAGTYHWLCCQRGGAIAASAAPRRAVKHAPGNAARVHQRTWIACAALSVVVRPSSALFWALPAGLELLRQRRSGLRLLLVDACVFAGALLAGALLVDRAAYGR